MCPLSWDTHVGLWWKREVPLLVLASPEATLFLCSPVDTGLVCWVSDSTPSKQNSELSSLGAVGHTLLQQGDNCPIRRGFSTSTQALGLGRRRSFQAKALLCPYVPRPSSWGSQALGE